MKHWLLFLLCALCCVCTVSGCGVADKQNTSGGTMDKKITVKDLLHHRFELVSVDGQLFKKERTPTIEFNEGLRVTGQICNRFMGQGELDKDVLKVRQMAATLMMCPDQELSTLEYEFFLMMDKGMEISLDGTTLHLRRDGRELTYERKDWLQ